MDMQDRTAIVTGAASGIGRALAHALHDRGARLVVVDRDRHALQQVADEVNGRAVVMDVASAADNDRLASAVGAPTLLCLNAGVTSTTPGPVWEAPPYEWRRVVDINLGGIVNGLRAFIPRMLDDRDHHHILITASLAGLATWPGGGPYGASKHAAVTVAEQAVLALADEPISVTLLCPALVRTGMSEQGADPADIAVEALDAVGERRFVVTPDEWTTAIVDRAHQLAAGEPPRIPTPTDSPTTAQGSRANTDGG